MQSGVCHPDAVDGAERVRVMGCAEGGGKNQKEKGKGGEIMGGRKV